MQQMKQRSSTKLAAPNAFQTQQTTANASTAYNTAVINGKLKKTTSEFSKDINQHQRVSTEIHHAHQVRQTVFKRFKTKQSAQKQRKMHEKHQRRLSINENEWKESLIMQRKRNNFKK